MGSVELGNEADAGLLLEGGPIEVKEVEPKRVELIVTNEAHSTNPAV
jgi:hypothetical protein